MQKKVIMDDIYKKHSEMTRSTLLSGPIDFHPQQQNKKKKSKKRRIVIRRKKRKKKKFINQQMLNISVGISNDDSKKKKKKRKLDSDEIVEGEKVIDIAIVATSAAVNVNEDSLLDNSSNVDKIHAEREESLSEKIKHLERELHFVLEKNTSLEAKLDILNVENESINDDLRELEEENDDLSKTIDNKDAEYDIQTNFLQETEIKRLNAVDAKESAIREVDDVADRYIKLMEGMQSQLGVTGAELKEAQKKAKVECTKSNKLQERVDDLIEEVDGL